MSKLYSEDHEWIEPTDDPTIYRVGISDHAQEELGDMVFVELPEVGSQTKKGDTVGTIESVKAASELYAPVGGEVAKVNDGLEDDPGTVNRSAEGDGWLYEVRLANPKEVEDLMDEDAYKAFVS